MRSVAMICAVVLAALFLPALAAAKCKARDKGTCLDCHTGITKGLKHIHGPVAVGSCVFCHVNPSPKATNVFTRTDRKTCLACHETRRFTFRFQHSALKQGCGTCHAPHGGQRDHFLRSDPGRLCGNCHGGSKMLASKTRSNCMGCHDPHGSSRAHLIRTSKVKTGSRCSRGRQAKVTMNLQHKQGITSGPSAR